MESGGARRLCWTDAFPWLGVLQPTHHVQTDSPLDEDAWNDAVDPGAAVTEPLLAVVCELALDRMAKRWTLAELFPLVPGAVPLDELGLSVRAKNALTNAGCFTTDDLASMELRDLLDVRSLGLGTVDDVVTTLARLSITAEVLSRPSRGERQGFSAPANVDERVAEDWLLNFRSRAIELSRWNVLIGIPDEPILDLHLRKSFANYGPTPTLALEGLSARVVLPDSELAADIATVLDRLVARYDERTQLVLRMRFFADEPATLESIGRPLNVTRERVRQVEGLTRADLASELAPGGGISEIGLAIRARIRNVLPLSLLLESFPALGNNVPLAGQPGWRVIDRIDDDYEIEEGWCVAPSMEGATQLTLAKLEEMSDDYGLVSFAQFVEWFPSIAGIQPFESGAADWLKFLGLPRYREYIVTRHSSIGDWIAAVLAAEKRPMTPEELLDAIPLQRSLASLKNLLTTDPRVRRIDRAKWALAEWGIQEYRGIRDLIGHEVTQAGGQIPLDQLVTQLSGSFDVNPSSIRAYASVQPFVIKGGVVSYGSASEQRPTSRKTLANTRHLYECGDSVVLRIVVTSEHMRGSGFPLPIAVASEFSVAQGETLDFDSSAGSQTLRWTGHQPTMSSIRRFLIELDSEPGDQVLLRFGRSLAFSVEATDSSGRLSPLQTAASLIGCEFSGDPVADMTTLATAIGLPPNATIAGIVGALEDRGEAELTALLLAGSREIPGNAVGAAGPAQDVDEILELL